MVPDVPDARARRKSRLDSQLKARWTKPSSISEDTRSFIIKSGANEGQQGGWTRTFAVESGKHYRFSALRKMAGVENERRFGVARIHWRDKDGKHVHHAETSTASYAPGATVASEPEYPIDGEKDASGWTELTGVYFGTAERFTSDRGTRIPMGS